MRGSSAGLADTLSGGSGLRAVGLFVLDAAFAASVLAPLVVAYWKSTWTLLDLYLLPDRPEQSAWWCACAGLLVGLLLCVFQTELGKRVRSPLLSRACVYVASVACVGAWRGLWALLSECSGDGSRSLLATTAAAGSALAVLRSLRNVCAAPFAIALDAPKDFFDVPTIFRTNSRDPVLYILDCVFSVVVVGSLVVFVWRGSWALLDIYLMPDDAVKSCWISLIGGYALVALTFSLQSAMQWAAARLHGALRLLLADAYHLLSFAATVNVWRGVWGLLDNYLFPDYPELSNWGCHAGSFLLLVLMNCSNSLLVRGVYIDAEEPGGECVIFPCHYLRLRFYQERLKRRHKKALAEAAKRNAQDAASEPLHLPEEKV